MSHITSGQRLRKYTTLSVNSVLSLMVNACKFFAWNANPNQHAQAKVLKNKEKKTNLNTDIYMQMIIICKCHPRLCSLPLAQPRTIWCVCILQQFEVEFS